MARTIFLTGGSGFVGQNVIPELIKWGYQVKALARSKSSIAKVEALGAKGVLGDLEDSNSYRTALKTVDFVVHAAAYMDFSYDRKKFYEINVNGTEMLLKEAKQCGVNRFVYIGAASVVNGGVVKDADETFHPKQDPRDLYSKTKLIAERAVINANTSMFQTLSLRPPAIWGPDNPHYDDMLKMVKEGKWMWIGKGDHVLSTIHVLNLANAIRAALTSEKSGNVYYVTDGEKRPMKQFFTELLATEGLNPGDRKISRSMALMMANFMEVVWKLFGLKSQPPLAPVMVKLMGTEFSVVDQRAREELGYQNAISIEEGLERIRIQNQQKLVNKS